MITGNGVTTKVDAVYVVLSQAEKLMSYGKLVGTTEPKNVISIVS
jgi:hypothetical protein